MRSKQTIDITILDIDGWFFNEETKENMNQQARQNGFNIYYDYPHIGGPSLELWEGFIRVGVPILQGIIASGLYDAIKYTLKQLFERIRPLANAPAKKPTILIQYNDEIVTMDFDFDLNEQQKDAAIKASIKALKSLVHRAQN